MDLFGLDLTQTTGDSVYDQNDIINAFSDDIILEEPTASSFAAIACSVQVPKIPEPFPDVPIKKVQKVQKVQKAFKAQYGRTSKGTLKRKVIGDGDNFVSDI